jgi:hypothetical protein
MRVAFLGWGSLYWNPGTLRVSGNWQSDGPRLPIEFARISRNGRPSLVIYEAYPDGRKTEDVEVLWVEAADIDSEAARKNLAYRENPDLERHENEPDFPERLAGTAALVRVSDPDSPDEYVERIKSWARPKGLDAVVWTALESNWDDSDHPPPEPFRSLVPQQFSCDSLKIYLKRLQEKQTDTTRDASVIAKYASALDEAEKYVRLAPRQISTHCRGELERDAAFKWTPFTSTGINSTIGETPATHAAAPERPSPAPPATPPKAPAEPDRIEQLRRLTRRARQFLAYVSVIFEDPRQGGRTEPADTQSQDFSAEFGRMSKLLDFLMNEGHPFHVPDQIIDEFAAARELLKPPSRPNKEDYAKLTKAYRDMVTISQNSVTFDGMPPMHFWSRRSPWLLLFLLIGIIPSVIWLIVLLGHHRWFWYYSLIYAGVSLALFWGLYIFTGVVTNSKLNNIIRYCYLFTGVALIGSLLPWAAPGLFVGGPSAAPLGVLQGCAFYANKDNAATATSNNGIPGEVLCGSNNYQWVVNVGGVAERLAAEKSATLQSASAETGATSSGERTASRTGRGQIRGGVVVPLYVIVLALFGSAVSMTRRVPEYQRRALDSQDSLSNVQAREYLVFQIMQVLSAPLIAITVYYIVKPDNQFTSVVLGFGSGFASEPILLMIRSLVEKLSPAKPAEPNPGPITLRVDPATVALKPNQTQQFNAKVFGSTNADVTWQVDPPDVSSGTISQSGYYVAPGAPPSKVVTITAYSAADRTKSGKASVTVSA